MTRPRAAVLAAFQLGLHALLLAGALAGLPDGVRLAAAFLALVLLPGCGWLAVTGATPPGGAALAPGWGLGLGVAWMAALVLATRALHLPFTVLAGAAAWLSLAPWAIVLARGRRGEGAPAPGLAGLALAAVLAAAFLAGLHGALHGTSITYYSDSPDHIGTIRRMLASGDAFPTDAFFRDAGPLGADPRKGLWHPVVALLCRLSGVDPWPAWRLLPVVMAPLFVLNAAAFAWLLGGGLPAAVGAWALLLTYGHSLAAVALREAGVATKVADQLAIATVAAVLADLAAPRARTRLVAIGLAMGAIATHVFAAVDLATVLGALGAGLLVRDRGARPEFRRLLVTALLIGAAGLPYLLWRAGTAYAPLNPIHTEPQGLLWLGDSAFVVNPGTFWEWFGFGAFLFPLSAWAWARASRRTPVLYLLTCTVAVFAIMLFPPVTMALRPKLGYLLMRFVWLLPLFAAIAFAVDALVGRVRRGGAWRRASGALGLAGLALLLAAPVGDAARAFTHPGTPPGLETLAGMEAWRGPLAWMDAHLPPGTVVLSDPVTSYAVPMATRLWVATLVDQHSSPNDSLALVRLLQARDALDPYATWARTREVIAARGATAIVLNDRFREAPRLDYWAPGHAWFRAARARFDRQPGAFPRLYDAGDFVVYGIRADSLAALPEGGTPPPFVAAGADPAARSMGPGLPALAGFRLGRTVARRGDTLSAVCTWTTARPLPAGSYAVALRFDRSLPADFHAPAWLGKPARKLYEHRAGERFRFRADHLPVAGAYGLDRWRPGERVVDSTRFVVPGDVAPGDYQVQVRMLREPHYPNYHLRDLLEDHDYYTGVPVGTLRVVAGAGR